MAKRDQKCEDGCTCGRHRAQRCATGCTCNRHKSQATPEQKLATRRRRAEWNRQYAAARRAADPAFGEAERERNRIHGRRYMLKYRFGLTPEKFDQLLIGQAGRCYLCADPLVENFAIDHDHSCCPGAKTCGSCIRGLACRSCNTGIGHFRDDPERMRRVADALEQAMKIRS